MELRIAFFLASVLALSLPGVSPNQLKKKDVWPEDEDARSAVMLAVQHANSHSDTDSRLGLVNLRTNIRMTGTKKLYALRLTLVETGCDKDDSSIPDDEVMVACQRSLEAETSKTKICIVDVEQDVGTSKFKVIDFSCHMVERQNGRGQDMFGILRRELNVAAVEDSESEGNQLRYFVWIIVPALALVLML